MIVGFLPCPDHLPRRSSFRDEFFDTTFSGTTGWTAIRPGILSSLQPYDMGDVMY